MRYGRFSWRNVSVSEEGFASSLREFIALTYKRLPREFLLAASRNALDDVSEEQGDGD
jgi:hypothetical protein